ncbi:MAG: hypothetical protein ACRYFY_19595 [Janthinobacterium lividum]
MDATMVSSPSIQSHIERIERAQEETRQFVAEQHALAANAMKRSWNPPKDLDRESLLVPLFLVAIASGVIGATAASLDFWLT